MNAETISFQAFIIEVINNNEITGLSVENMKFLLDKSIIKLFGALIGHKLSYKLTMINKANIFELTFPNKNKNILLTALMMISDLEYKIRIKKLSNRMDISD